MSTSTALSSDSSVEFAVKNAQLENEGLIARSQAKNLLTRVAKSQCAALDFEGVALAGPASADQVFRIFARESPDVEIIVKNAAQEVLKAIRIAQSHT